MFALGLLTCIVLGALSAQAKVSNDFDCKEFFYKDIEPTGMDQNAKKICQWTSKPSYYYATLYSVHHRIPLYSAYRFDPACSSDSGSSSTWHLEPQISQPTSQMYYMVREDQKTQKSYKENQAISSDYTDSGFDRGHLYPNSFQCSDGRTATFTLTNAAPMDRCFNRIHWKDWESALRSFLEGKLKSGGASTTAYIVTGIVPSATERIPRRGTSGDSGRVTVPSHIWTAVCYKHNSDDTKSFSFSYMGENKPEPGIRLMSVSDLNNQLKGLYSGNPKIKIFKDDCFGDTKSDEVKTKFQKLMSLDVPNTLKRTSSSDSLSSKTNVKVKKN
ncbi:endonuclease domain-containing 1 protein-like [Onychostoma macrolepis]|uniref:Endonuclease domain-containing 1 protein n=1 Tax=Onychostoma macrolepis TaxID=369639 RepID=A0A7J6D6Y7_9TELE|nr:endonuclease domain-containing 1 protein-like [Onychostoma macrolepis]XP_058627998.1 endonuclease domain-containing 1 protein-like [Onychostoma macrolepis]XP_058627999.1 endonuclease domain-containing 1 protein-like [Onychostoma macrolepis]XP_058628000.1 endonuclease domain-containing 1 protein-like [Onychostoma macrolepis]XP_058628001.1 endonuclease domain-containing 1 protein-like [Onychostoma macrolepis]XP_058628002.1 endonuclease domain-containing 1 protein-like [Onychostoma macrolepis]